MIQKAPKRVRVLRVACALLLAALFVAGQVLHASAAAHEVCHLKAVTSKHAHSHSASTGQHSAHQGGCCCDTPATCDCNLSQGSDDEGSVLPVTAATNSRSPMSVNPGAVQAHGTVLPQSLVQASSLGWTRARAPSENLFPDTTKLIC
jgi:hypothetical protein